MDLNVFPEFEQMLRSNIDSGSKIAERSNLCITGLCRDIEDKLPAVLKGIDYIGSFFNKCYYFIYENDSTDDTPNILHDWCKTPNKKVLCEKLNSTHPVGNKFKDRSRTEALSKYRNICKSSIKNTFSDIDYVLVIDMDFMNFAPIGILNSLGWIDSLNFGAIAGNSFSQYLQPNQSKILLNYDSWAFRYNWWSDYQPYIMRWFMLWEPFFGSPPIQVNSAFGGSCIYKKDFYFSDCQYEGYDCEHVCFHKNLYNQFPNFKLGLNPSQIMILYE
jgi:hypothetical protein